MKTHPIFAHLFDAMREQGLSPPDVEALPDPATELPDVALSEDDYAQWDGAVERMLAGLPRPLDPLSPEQLAEGDATQFRG